MRNRRRRRWWPSPLALRQDQSDEVRSATDAGLHRTIPVSTFHVNRRPSSAELFRHSKPAPTLGVGVDVGHHPPRTWSASLSMGGDTGPAAVRGHAVRPRGCSSRQGARTEEANACRRRPRKRLPPCPKPVAAGEVVRPGGGRVSLVQNRSRAATTHVGPSSKMRWSCPCGQHTLFWNKRYKSKIVGWSRLPAPATPTVKEVPHMFSDPVRVGVHSGRGPPPTTELAARPCSHAEELGATSSSVTTTFHRPSIEGIADAKPIPLESNRRSQTSRVDRRWASWGGAHHPARKIGLLVKPHWKTGTRSCSPTWLHRRPHQVAGKAGSSVWARVGMKRLHHHTVTTTYMEVQVRLVSRRGWSAWGTASDQLATAASTQDPHPDWEAPGEKRTLPAGGQARPTLAHLPFHRPSSSG